MLLYFLFKALDAAQLGFEGSDPLVRLNLTDAHYIDVIHTNGKPTVPTFGLGFITTLGSFVIRYFIYCVCILVQLKII